MERTSCCISSFFSTIVINTRSRVFTRENRNHLPGNDELEKDANDRKNHFMTRFKVAFKSSFLGNVCESDSSKPSTSIVVFLLSLFLLLPLHLLVLYLPVLPLHRGVHVELPVLAQAGGELLGAVDRLLFRNSNKNNNCNLLTGL